MPAGPSILIVDDDPRLADLLVRGLGEAGYTATAAPCAAAAREVLASEATIDLLLVDVMMPDEDGWSLVRGLRRAGDTTPVIFVTARDAVAERVKGLELGADDYLIKPFDFQELVARVRAVLRRHASPGHLRVGEFEFDADKRIVYCSDHRFELSPREFGLLMALARHADVTCSRAELLREVWGIDFEPGTNTVDVHVARLRRRFGADLAQQLQTVHGEGYRLLTRVLDDGETAGR